MHTEVAPVGGVITAPAPRPRRRGGPLAVLVALVAVATALLLALHGQVPDVYGIGSLVESFLPWSGVLLLVLAGVAALRRSWAAVVAVAFAAGVWAWVCWPLTAPDATGAGDLVVVQHNVSDENTDPLGTAEVLLAAEPDVLTLVEVTPALDAAITAEVSDELPYRAVLGTVGIWSRYPLADVESVDFRPTGVVAQWQRGIRAVVDRPDGVDPVVYAIHAPSVRLVPRGGFTSSTRDRALGLLGDVLADDPRSVVVLGGDLNTTLLDRALAPVLREVTTPAGSFGGTFPAAVPLVRIDHVLARGAEVTGVSALGSTGSDHLPVVADVDLPDG
ncbi:endonuclease/exonuclease/phosphatase family protein [Isoptericola jiangsuensis]|uniref:endonuclease/exonuclease/phosphatase family protein n=1 Tax=Isoptericola jiangsuensis TaxID=548579 RepID=UPI003AAE67F5